MIAHDQPTCFNGAVLAAVSSKSDGTMLDRAIGVHNGSIVSNRTLFCQKLKVDYGDIVFQRIIYADNQSYKDMAEVDDRSTTKNLSEVAADALYTTALGVGLFLPVGDCVATVLYDPKRKALALAHLGRHSSYSKLARGVTEQFISQGSEPKDIVVWMSPHAKKDSYKLSWFDKADDPDWQGFYEVKPDGTYLDLAGFNGGLLKGAGVLPSNIHVSSVDTMQDSNYFSHAGGDTTGRIGVIAMMK